MPIHIRHIATRVPETVYAQEEIGEAMLQQLERDGKGARLLQRVYRHSGIESRHSVIRDYRDGSGGGIFYDGERHFLSPSTKVRNDLYTREARGLFMDTARAVLDEAPGIDSPDVTHVVTVSCTGFFAPGPDFYLVRDLDLNPTVKRFHIGFMGCFGAFPALEIARSVCGADPSAVVLVVCLELCTLHLEPSDDIDDIIATSVFADGAAAALVTAEPGDDSSTTLRIDDMRSNIAPDSEKDMAWTIGDHGFDMVLSTYVPRVLEANIAPVVESMFEGRSIDHASVEHWAVHPGGRALLDKIESALGLDDEALACSREVLRRYGNMSSATILFVLFELMDSGRLRTDDSVFAMAFGPGLTIESALLSVS